MKSQTDVRHAITFLLETIIGVDVKGVATLQEALACLLENEGKFDVVICDDNIESQKLFKYLSACEKTAKCLVLRDPRVPSVLDYPDLILAHVNPAHVDDELKRIFAEKFNKTDEFESDDGGYCRIRALTVLQRSPIRFDLFVRLSANKYVRVFKKGDVFVEADVGHILSKKQIEYLYFVKEDAATFAAELKDSLDRAFKLASATPESTTKAAAAAQEAVLELGSKIGFTPEVQAAAKQSMILTLKTIGTGKPQLVQIVKGIFAERDNYVGSHAILTSQVACSLAKSMEWSSETTFQKLTYAAFFHDMTITNRQLVQVKDLSELESRRTEFTSEEFKVFSTHPTAAAQVISGFSEVPSDVDQIIGQHHEKADGTGFPRKLNGANISPLSALFIVAHDIVDYLFENGTKGLDQYFEEYKKKYSVGHFKKILSKLDLNQMGFGADPDVAAPPKGSAKV